MQAGSVDPTKSASAIEPVNDARIGPVPPGRVPGIGNRIPIPGSGTSEHDSHDSMEVHVNGVARRAYAQFMAHPETGQVSIKIIDADTKQVIREIPSEEVIRLAEQLQSYWELRNTKMDGR